MHRWDSPPTIAALLSLFSILAAVGASAQDHAQATFAEVTRIPAREGADDPAFHVPVGTFLDAAGTIYVLDMFENTVRVFGQDGRLARSFGGAGRGPGEFVRPNGLHPAGDRLYVTDMGNRRLTWFSWTGGYLGSRSYPRPDRDRRESMWRVLPLRNGRLLMESMIAYGDIRGKQDYGDNRMVVYDAAGSVLQVLATYPSGWPYAYARNRPWFTMPIGTSYGVGALSAVLGDSVLTVVDTYRGQIRYFVVDAEGVRPLRTRELGWTPVPVVVPRSEDRERRQRKARTMRGTSAGDIVVVYPEYRGLVDVALSASNGDLWLRRTAEPRIPERFRHDWVVVPWNADAPPSELALPENFDLYAISEDRLVGFCRDEHRVATLCVYRMSLDARMTVSSPAHSRRANL